MYGPKTEVYVYKVGMGEWEKLILDKTSEYQGGVKSFSLCSIGLKTYLTGGVMVSNNTPLQSVFEVNHGNMLVLKKKKNMLGKRYGHCSACVKGVLYVMGGFAHQDKPREPT